MSSTNAERFTVQVIFANVTTIWRKYLMVTKGATAGEAIARSGFADTFPEFTDVALPIGIFGERCTPERTLRAGDRVEIYRPLVFDPQESRRRRATHKAERRHKKTEETL